MRSAEVFVNDNRAGILEELAKGSSYRFTYDKEYSGPLVSLTLPLTNIPYTFEYFPPFFEGLLPEGYNLEALLRTHKIDRNDFFSQLITVGMDMVGAVTVSGFK
jgi:serine/threonine-protein kinase HipA